MGLARAQPPLGPGPGDRAGWGRPRARGDIDRVLGCTEFFNLAVMPCIFFFFSFCCLCFGYHIQAEKSLPNPMS